jgi:Kef-type K+ transport system membrane component KefB
MFARPTTVAVPLKPHHRWLSVPFLLALAAPAVAGHTLEPTHADPVAPVILGVTGILFFAVLGRFGARRLGQPAVLGELVMGLILGNVGYLLGLELMQILREGPAIFDLVRLDLAGDPLQHAAETVLGPVTGPEVLAILEGPAGIAMLQVAQTVDVFSRYGVIFLLFLIGLGTSLNEMRQVGVESLRVAVVGVLLPFVLGFSAARLLMPELSLNVDLFVAATLGATSIGISARVLGDLNQSQTREARVILGAAVLDDVLGLVMLAIVSGIVVSGSVALTNVATTVLLAALFIVLAFLLGPSFLDYAIRLVRHLDIVEAKMFISFLFVMALAWFANLVGLATIVGAFAAGVILHDGYFRHWGDYREHRFTIKDLIAPLETILVPIFFVLMGIQVKLETFLDWHVVTMAAGLLVAAIVGKVACGFVADREANRLAIGIGMMPRGEVGLIFAAIGKGLGVISDALFSAVVLMVIVTTLATPPLLKAVLLRERAQE